MIKKINAKIIGIIFIYMFFILTLNSFYIFSQDEEEFINVSPVEKKENNKVLEEGVVTPVEKTIKKTKTKKIIKLKSVERIITTDLKNKVKILVILSDKVKYKATEIAPPPNYRILLKLKKCTINTKTINVKKGSVVKIRTAPHKPDAWIVIDLKEKQKWKAYSKGKKIIVDINKKSVSAQKIKSRPKVRKKITGLIYRIIDVGIKNLKDKTRIIVTADGPVKYRIKKDQKNKTLFLNIVNAVSILDKKKIEDIGMVDLLSINENSKEKAVNFSIKFKENSPYIVSKDQNQIIIDIDNLVTKKGKKIKKLDIYKRISLNVQNANLPGVLRLLSSLTGFEFIVGPSVAQSQPVTIKENNRPFIQVLRDILIPQGLYYEIRGNLISIGNVGEIKQQKTLLPKITKFYYPRTMKAKELKDLLTVHISKDPLIDIALKEDTAQGNDRLMIVGTKEDVNKVMNMIENIEGGNYSYYDENYEIAGGIKTKIFKLQYSSPSDIKTTIQPLLSSEGKIQVDERTGSLIITDNIKYLKKVEKVIKKLDIRIPQVMIEAKLYEINVNEAKELGINWSGESQNNEPYIKGEMSGPAIAGAASLIVGTIQHGFKIDAYLNALESKSKASLLSAPKVTVENNKKAIIYTKRTTYYETTNVTTGSTGPPVVTTTYESIELPIQLEVTPKITDNNNINMRVVVTVTKMLGNVSRGGPPDTSTQNAETYVTAKNNETVVIGGMISERIVTTEEKTPILGDLPLIGLLFKGTKQSKDTVELLVFLTPSIVAE